MNFRSTSRLAASAISFEPVRQAFFSGQPIPWNRVNKLPDFVYFNHSIHLAKGVGCVTCHGRIDEMAEVAQGEPLTMEFCLNCHRNPEPQLRPKEYLTDMAWKPVEDPTVLGARLAEENDRQRQLLEKILREKKNGH